METLNKVNTDIGESNLVQINDGHDEFATLVQIINILRDEEEITSSERNEGIERVSRRKNELAPFLNKNK